MSTTSRAFVFHAKFAEFYYHKIFETTSWWWPKRLLGWMLSLWPLHNWRYKNLSMSHDQKVMMLPPVVEKSPVNFYHGVAFKPKFDNSSPSVTWDKEICDITTSWGRVPNGAHSVMFTYYPNLMFLASLWLEIHRFSNCSFCWLWAVQSWSSFWKVWASQNWPYLFSSTEIGQIIVILWCLGKTYHKEQSKKFKNLNRIWHKSFSVI